MTLRIRLFSNKRHKDVSFCSVTLAFKFDIPHDLFGGDNTGKNRCDLIFDHNSVAMLNVSYLPIPSIQPITHLDTSQSSKLAFVRLIQMQLLFSH